MSSTTATPEIHVPREFLPAFIEAVTFELRSIIEAAALEEVRPLTDERAAFVRAYDDGAPLDEETVRDHAWRALRHLRSDLHDGSRGIYDRGPCPSVDTLADTACLLRDLATWAAEHGFVKGEREAVAA